MAISASVLWALSLYLMWTGSCESTPVAVNMGDAAKTEPLKSFGDSQDDPKLIPTRSEPNVSDVGSEAAKIELTWGEDDVTTTADARENLNKRIINGKIATYGDHPYVCSLQTWSGRKSAWHDSCAAVIYNTNTVITAAHCLPRSANFLRVKCGEFNLKKPDYYEQAKSIKTIRTHPDYALDRTRAFPNDIALLELTSSLTFNGYVNTLPLDDGSIALNESCVLSGWGLTESSEWPSRLRTVIVKRLTHWNCANYYYLLKHSHVCFKNEGQADGACRGDSGGPAVCDNRLVGLSSFSMNECTSNYHLNIHTRLSFYHDWIVANAF